ncbi:MAG: hypothetical protein R6U32_00585, partial [Candidatus Woesearchaeota archaeon]
EIPEYEDFYSSETSVAFEIYDSSGSLVHSESASANIFMDTSEILRSSYVSLSPGDYNAVVRTDVTDDQCSSSSISEDSRWFTVEGDDVPECSDGIDNDGDGLTDMEDPGCSSPQDDDESDGTSECQDGIDNDGDGLIDYPEDPGCESPQDDDEYNHADHLDVALEAEPQSGEEPLDVVFNCSVEDGTGPFNFNFDSGSTSGVSWVAGAGGYRWQQFNASGYTAGTYSPVCTVEDVSTGAEGDESTIINVTEGYTPSDLFVDLISPSDGTVSNDPDQTFAYAVSENPVELEEGQAYSTVIDGIQHEITVADANDAGTMCGVSVDGDVVWLDEMTEAVINGVEIGLIDAEYGSPDRCELYVASPSAEEQLDCTLYNNMSGSFEPVQGHSTDLNSFDDFDVFNIDDGMYIWNVECSDGATATAPEDYTLTINTSTTELPECSDGIDNDGDGLIDMEDPGCSSPQDDDESDGAVCENHLEISQVEVSTTPVQEGNTITLSSDSLNTIPFDINFTNTGASEVTNTDYTISMASEPTGEETSEGAHISSIAPYSSIIEGQDFNSLPDPLLDGIYNMTIEAEGMDTRGCLQNDSFGFFIDLSPLSAPECSDGIDNDGDGLVDENDPGCYDSGAYDPQDDDETDTLPECADYFDNDNDGLIDYPEDPGCENTVDDDESDGQNQAPVVQLVYPFDGFTLSHSDAGFIYSVSDDNSMFVDCTLYNNVSGSFEPVETQTIMAGMYGLFNLDSIPNGDYIWNVECSDQDVSAFAPDNFSFTINATGQLPECSDGIDNDGDGLTDMEDPGCSSPQDDDESDGTSECQDGVDNDGDGLIDMEDPGCSSPQDDSEENGDDEEEDEGEGDEEEETIILDPDQILYIGHIDIHSTTNTGYEQEMAEAGDQVEVSVYMENLAGYDLENLALKVGVHGLGIWRESTFDLDKGDYATKHMLLDIPADADSGDYDVRITAENEDVKRVKYRLLTITE